MKYLNKRITVEAILYKEDGENSLELIAKLDKQFVRFDKKTKEITMKFAATEIKIMPGEYILRVQENAEFYPMDKAMFESQFEIIPDDWMEKVIQEKKELEEKLDKLTKFIMKNEEKMEEMPLDLLNTQADVMAAYNNILAMRVKYELIKRQKTVGCTKESKKNK